MKNSDGLLERIWSSKPILPVSLIDLLGDGDHEEDDIEVDDEFEDDDLDFDALIDSEDEL